MMYKISEGFYSHEDERFEDLDIGSFEDMQYHTSDDWIMPVARKVWRELIDTEMQLAIDKNNVHYGGESWKVSYNNFAKIHNEISNMQLAFTQPTSELCTACYNAIVFLNTLKPAQ